MMIKTEVSFQFEDFGKYKGRDEEFVVDCIKKGIDADSALSEDVLIEILRDAPFDGESLVQVTFILFSEYPMGVEEEEMFEEALRESIEKKGFRFYDISYQED